MKASIPFQKLILILIAFPLIFTFCSREPQKKADWQIAENPLLTEWSGEISPDNVLPEYPRPQMVRDHWLNLNGLWEYAIQPAGEAIPEEFQGNILVPFPVESALSGVGEKVGSENKLWYKRRFEIPTEWFGKMIHLNFGAVDWEAKIWINGEEAGQHRGGYDAFSFDITKFLKGSGEQEIVISVWDPVDEGTQPRGKQVSDPGGIWYTSVTGIWQTVWLEPLGNTYLDDLKIVTDIDKERVVIDPGIVSPDNNARMEVEILKEGQVVSSAEGAVEHLSLPVPNPELWSPDNPFLYDLSITLYDAENKVSDEVESYFGMREIRLGKGADGFTRMMLNEEFVFHFGFLDQGWWPDGLYTAPNDEALKYDIEVTKKLGFNLARKHVKIEPARWYYWCDKLGLLVWQDMPSGDEYIGRNDPDIVRSDSSDRQFRYELKKMVKGFFNHPSIVVWVPFNEGWGQYATTDIVNYIKELDSTRLVNAASGWADRDVGDIHDMHAYPGPAMPEPEENRAIVLGEFGGLGLPLEEHTWQEKDNWGYRSYESRDSLFIAYTDLIEKLKPMIDKGLSAAVYTQTTDVEIEVNGLMSYDRAVIKLDPGELSPVNQSVIDKSKHY